MVLGQGYQPGRVTEDQPKSKRQTKGHDANRISLIGCTYVETAITHGLADLNEGFITPLRYHHSVPLGLDSVSPGSQAASGN